MSIHTIPGSGCALSRLNLPDDHYVLNVTYDLIEGKRNRTGDTQLFVTGTVAEQEPPEAACLRELQEEVLMRPKNGLRHIYNTTEMRGRDARTVDWYECRLSELSEPESATQPRICKDGKNKVGCIVHGTYKEVLAAFGRIPVVSAAADGIIGVVCLRVGDIKRILMRIPKYYAHRDLFFWCYNWATRKCPRPAADVYAFSGPVAPAGMSAIIRAFIETMGFAAWNEARELKIDSSQAAHLQTHMQAYCEVIDCVLPAKSDSIYCSRH
jgi:ADP-ribose pyrophosphatase YjhB (NUDIX family)